MIQINLLPDVKKEFIKAQRTRNNVITGAMFTMAGSVGLVIVLAIVTYGGQAFAISQITNSIKNKESELKSVKDINKYLTVQNQLAHLSPLHDDKLIYSRMMDFLPSLNPSAPNTIQLDEMTIDSEDGTITFKGIAPSAQSFNTYKDTLVNADLAYSVASGEKQSEKLFDDIAIEQSTLGRVRNQTVLTFTVVATYNPNAFARSSQEVIITIPNMPTTHSIRSAPVFSATGNAKGGAQ